MTTVGGGLHLATGQGTSEVPSLCPLGWVQGWSSKTRNFSAKTRTIAGKLGQWDTLSKGHFKENYNTKAFGEQGGGTNCLGSSTCQKILWSGKR